MILTNRMLGDWHEVKALQDRVGENKQEKKAHAAGGAGQPDICAWRNPEFK